MDDGARVFSEDENGRLVAMSRAAPPSEDALQELIALFPDIVCAEDGELLLVRREQGVPGEASGSDRWSLDHLFISDKAVPVLIEVKRASDTRIRREVIGQILDYAANGVAYWPKGALEDAFAATCAASGVDPVVRLEEFLGERDASEFWAQAESNLQAGRLRLLIVADQIPRELARVVEFLNEQMRAEVGAVELRYFQSKDGRRTLAPRFIGETEKTRAANSGSSTSRLEPISVDDWFDKYIAPLGTDAAQGARRHLEFMRRLGGDVSVPSTQGSIAVRFDGKDGRNVFPMHLQRNGAITVSFGWTSSRPALLDEGVRSEILAAFSDAVGGLTTANLNGHPSFPASRLTDDDVFEAYEAAARRYVELASRGDADGAESGLGPADAGAKNSE